LLALHNTARLIAIGVRPMTNWSVIDSLVASTFLRRYLAALTALRPPLPLLLRFGGATIRLEGDDLGSGTRARIGHDVTLDRIRAGRQDPRAYGRRLAGNICTRQHLSRCGKLISRDIRAELAPDYSRAGLARHQQEPRARRIR
jgi:hypothetical protein